MMSLWWQEVMVGLMVAHKQIWWDKESFNTTYNRTFLLLKIYTINLSHSCYTELAKSLIFINVCRLEMDCRCFHYLIHCLYCSCLEDCLVTSVVLVTIIELYSSIVLDLELFLPWSDKICCWFLHRMPLLVSIR